MENQNGANNKMVIPAFKQIPKIELDMNASKEAEARFIEAKDVNPITYAELEHVFGASFQELKRHHSTVTYQLEMANKALAQAKSDVLLDKYPDFLAQKTAEAKEKGVKFQDSADHREAYLIRDQAYLEAYDRVAMLKAVESFIDGRIKVIENISRYMKKRMDLVIRSGLSNSDLYITGGKKWKSDSRLRS